MSGWGSWLKGDAAAAGSGAAAASGSNFHAITDTVPQDALFGPLEASDLEWTCAGGFTTETQTWYSVLEDGSFATSQIIHSAVGLWYPQVQMTFKYFNPKTGKKIWKSVNVTKFATQTDKRSSKAAEFTVNFTTDAGEDKYTITANLETDLQLSWSFTRPVSVQGWKLGSGPKGGFSYFGSNPGSPDGYVIHRFWPVAESEGHILTQSGAIDAKGKGMFVHAIQGMRPNLVAAKWNFANFQAHDDKLGRVSGVMMEFTTTPDYGSAESTNAPRQSLTVNIGSIVANDKLVAVTAATRRAGAADSEPSRNSDSYVKHLDKTLDKDTGYQAPQSIVYRWQGPLLDTSSGKGDVDKQVEAKLNVDLGKPYPSNETHGLVDKVDVLAEIPYMVRKLVNYVAGTKPYIYQTLNPATLTITMPGQDSAEVKGTLFEEHTFISG